MKCLYVCEKCGSRFENYEDAEKCESVHSDIDATGEFLTETSKFARWTNGSKLPNEIVLQTYCEYGKPVDENGDPTCKFGVYVLKRELRNAEALEIVKAYNKRKDDEEKWYSEYRKQREEAKEANVSNE